MDLFEVKNVKQVKSIIVSAYRIRKTEQGGWFNKKQVLIEEKVEDCKAVYANGIITKKEERKKGFEPIVTLYKNYMFSDSLLQFGTNRCNTSLLITNKDGNCIFYQNRIHHKEDGKSFYAIDIRYYEWEKEMTAGAGKKTYYTFNPEVWPYNVIEKNTEYYVNYLAAKMLMIEKLVLNCDNENDKEIKDLKLALSTNPFSPTWFYNVNNISNLLYTPKKSRFILFDIPPKLERAGVLEQKMPIKEVLLFDKSSEFSNDGYGNWIECRCYDPKGNYTELFTRTIEYVD